MQFTRVGKNITIWSKLKSIDWPALSKAYYANVPDTAVTVGGVLGGLGGILFSPLIVAQTLPQAMIMTPIFGLAGTVAGGSSFYVAAYVAPPLVPVCLTGAGIFYLK